MATYFLTRPSRDAVKRLVSMSEGMREMRTPQDLTLHYELNGMSSSREQITIFGGSTTKLFCNMPGRSKWLLTCFLPKRQVSVMADWSVAIVEHDENKMRPAKPQVERAGNRSWSRSQWRNLHVGFAPVSARMR